MNLAKRRPVDSLMRTSRPRFAAATQDWLANLANLTS